MVNEEVFARKGAKLLCMFLVALAVLSVYGAANAHHSDLLGWWQFDEGSGQIAADTSGHGNHGQFGSTTSADDNDPTWIAGLVGPGALNFNGGQYVEVPDSPTLEPSTITVEAWVRHNGSPGTFSYILSKGQEDSCIAVSYALYTGFYGGLNFAVYHGSGNYTLSPDAGMGAWDGNWHHVVGTYDRSMVRLYVDGVEIGSGTPATLPIAYGLPTSELLYIGSPGVLCGDAKRFPGDIDEVKVWNGALTSPLTNRPPVAIAGPDQSATVGSVVTLDGSQSVDPDGDPLTYLWSVVSIPSGSTATLSDPTIATPTFTTDRAGSYTFQLVVNDGKVSSGPDTVTVSTVNSKPVAAAGPDQSAPIGTAVTLDGSTSYDPDGDPITFAWNLLSKPAASSAVLSDPTTVNPSFTIDAAGTYTVQLVVSDGFLESDPDTVTISTVNSAPVANAGPDRSVYMGTIVVLDGSGSSDPDGDPITFAWSFVSIPTGSTAVLNNATTASPSFTADLAGSYIVQLIVSDGTASSADTVVVVAVDPRIILSDLIKTIINKINGLPPTAFKNPNMARPLTNKLEAVLRNVEAGNYADALNQVENDIIKKTDGCAIGGAPDANDFIVTCPEQGQIYPDLITLRDELRRLTGQ